METKEKNYAEELDSAATTIATNVEKKSGTGLTSAINKWVDVLDAHKDLMPIAGNLKKLLVAIDHKKGDDIVTLMATLGEETTKAAEMAAGDEMTKIKALGKALTAGSRAIAKFA